MKKTFIEKNITYRNEIRKKKIQKLFKTKSSSWKKKEIKYEYTFIILFFNLLFIFYFILFIKFKY